MTALPQYVKLEAPGLWRENAEAQRREVIVSFGDATLVISDGRSARPLTHWSLAALVRRNPGQAPALYAPSEEPGEDLEIDDDTMTAAIEKVLSSLEAARPHPGRLRGWLAGGIGGVVALGLLLWLPSALERQAARVAPPATQLAVGRAILADIATQSGSPCHSMDGDAALGALAERLGLKDRRIAILPRGEERRSETLPGDIVLVGRKMLGPDTPEAIAGAVLAAETAAHDAPPDRQPLRRFLDWAGMNTAFQLLVTGDLPKGAARGYGKILLADPAPEADNDALLAAFQAAGVSSTPYAYALDPSGETTLPLIEADPFKGRPAPEPVLEDQEWQALRQICD